MRKTFKDLKTLSLEMRGDKSWYAAWKLKHGISSKDSEPEVASKILENTWTSCLIDAYSKLEEMAKTDPEAKAVFYNNPTPPYTKEYWLNVIAANLADERGVEIPKDLGV